MEEPDQIENRLVSHVKVIDVESSREEGPLFEKFTQCLEKSSINSYSYASCGYVDTASKLLDESLGFCFSGLEACNAGIGSFMKSGHVDFARKVFVKLPERDVVSWNSLIGGYVMNGQFSEALRLSKEMISSHIDPDEFTFSSLAAACAQLGALHQAEWLHGLMNRRNLPSNEILQAALVDMYAKCGRIELSKEIFQSINKPCLSAWNAMINGLALHGLALEAISVFSEMEQNNIIPDALTFVGVLKACSHSGLIEQGQQHFDIMTIKYHIKPQLEHYGAMVDLLARAGCLEEAYSTIRGMPMKPDDVIWRALLSACRTHKNTAVAEIAVSNITSLKGGDYVLLSNTYCHSNKWNSAASVRNTMRRDGVRKDEGKSWVEMDGIVYNFKSGDRSHPETGAIYKILEGLSKRAKREGYVCATELVLMDITEEEKEDNLSYHSEKIALCFVILRTGPGTEVRVFKNLRTCHDCHNWFKVVSGLLNRVIVVRDRIRFHRFESGSCSCGDYW
ncbi:hypothetical protein V2J09_020619 [Rumex salicifolius]